MRFKVYFLMFLAFLLISVVNSAGNFVGEKLKLYGSNAIVDHVAVSLRLEGKPEPSQLESQLVDGSSSELADAFKLANRDVSNNYGWYFVASLAIQAILIVSIIVVFGNLIIGTIKRGLLL